jgi:hypothetical protein
MRVRYAAMRVRYAAINEKVICKIQLRLDKYVARLPKTTGKIARYELERMIHRTSKKLALAQKARQEYLDTLEFMRQLRFENALLRKPLP